MRHCFNWNVIFTGLVANVYAADELVDKAMAKAEKIASLSHISTKMAKEAVNSGKCRLPVTITLLV